MDAAEEDTVAMMRVEDEAVVDVVVGASVLPLSQVYASAWMQKAKIDILNRSSSPVFFFVVTFKSSA